MIGSLFQTKLHPVHNQLINSRNNSGMLYYINRYNGKPANPANPAVDHRRPPARIRSTRKLAISYQTCVNGSGEPGIGIFCGF
jgi:hypothetical protein